MKLSCVSDLQSVSVVICEPTVKFSHSTALVVNSSPAVSFPLWYGGVYSHVLGKILSFLSIERYSGSSSVFNSTHSA